MNKSNLLTKAASMPIGVASDGEWNQVISEASLNDPSSLKAGVSDANGGVGGHDGVIIVSSLQPHYPSALAL